MKVLRTTNYRLFERSSDNRQLVPAKHKRLMESMRLYGFLPEFPIVCRRNGNSKLVVKDGQHRLSIAETLGLPVFYCIESADWDVAVVNSTAKTWTPIDYARRYATQGIADYQEGIDFMAAHRMPVGISFALLAGTTSFGNVSKDFLVGDFRVKDRKWADAVAALYVPFATASRDCKNARFIGACMAICRVDGFDANRMLRSLRRCRDKLASYSTRDAWLEVMEDIYNYGRKQLFSLKNEAIMAMRARNATTPKADKAAA